MEGISNNITAGIQTWIPVQGNGVFVSLFVVACMVIIGFLLASWHTNSKRGTVLYFNDTILNMLKHPSFYGALMGSVGFALTMQFELMFVTVMGFIAYKTVATTTIILKNGDNKAAWFDSPGWNSTAAIIISTKTLMLLFFAGLIFYAGYKEFYPASLVSERIAEALAAWGAANGIGWLAGVGKKDLGFLAPTPSVKKVEATIQKAESTQPKQIPAPIATKPTEEAETRPPYIEFNPEEWQRRTKAIISVGSSPDGIVSSSAWKEYITIDGVAMTEICFYMQNAIDFVIWKTSMAYKAFKEKFGFEFNETYQHFNDAKLLKCPVTDIDSFLFALGRSFTDIYKETEDAALEYRAFSSQLTRLGEARVTQILKAGRWTYFEVLYKLGDLKS